MRPRRSHHGGSRHPRVIHSMPRATALGRPAPLSPAADRWPPSSPAPPRPRSPGYHSLVEVFQFVGRLRAHALDPCREGTDRAVRPTEGDDAALIEVGAMELPRRPGVVVEAVAEQGVEVPVEVRPQPASGPHPSACAATAAASGRHGSRLVDVPAQDHARAECAAEGVVAAAVAAAGREGHPWREALELRLLRDTSKPG